MNSMSVIGKRSRLKRLFDASTGRTVIVPIDDSLIFGPFAGLEDPKAKVSEIVKGQPNGVLAFAGMIKNHVDALFDTPKILNLTASTVRSHHTHKVLVGSVACALKMNIEAVAVHVNVSSTFEPEMLRVLGKTAEECDEVGLPLLAIMYPRKEMDGRDDNYDLIRSTEEYRDIVAHSARIATDLGADIIKTQFTGTSMSFERVVKAAYPIPVIVAGGPLKSDLEMLKMAAEVVNAGGMGVSYGRNVFSRANSKGAVEALKAVVHKGVKPEQAAEILKT